MGTPNNGQSLSGHHLKKPSLAALELRDYQEEVRALENVEGGSEAASWLRKNARELYPRASKYLKRSA